MSTPPRPPASTQGPDRVDTRPGLLEIAVAGAQDAPGAEGGGADRLVLARPGAEGGLSPSPDAVQALCEATSLPVRVVLRLNDGYSTTGGELARLVGLAADYLDRGAEGLVMGFLDRDLEIDTEVCSAIAERLPGLRWTFSRVIDSTLDARRAWRLVRELPGVDSVCTAGSVRGMEHGAEVVIARSGSDPGAAELMVAAGGLRADQVPWLVRAGVRAVHVSTQVRPSGSWDKAYVEESLVRSWRRLLDAEVAAANR